MADRVTALRNRYQRGEVAPSSHKHVLLACMPKSGSSYLISMVAGLPGFRRVALIRGHDRREHELSLDLLARHHEHNYVAQAHLRHSATTARFIRTFSLAVVFQIRNLYDVVVSFHDHKLNLSRLTPIANVPDEFPEWPEERRLMFVADMAVPWYLNFFLSWQEFEGDKLTVNYRDLIRDPRAQLRRVAEHAGIDCCDEDIERAVAITESTRLRTFNVGGEGRGERLPEAVKRRIDTLLGYYPSADFSPIL